MKDKFLILIVILSVVLSFLIGHYVFPKVIETEIPVYIEPECKPCPDCICPEPTVIEIIKEYKSLSKEDMKEYYKEVMENYEPKTEIRPINYVPYCDRKGVVC